MGFCSKLKRLVARGVCNGHRHPRIPGGGPPEVQYETNVCARQMKQPTQNSWRQLKRIVRYLAGTTSARTVLLKPNPEVYVDEVVSLLIWVDSDWAGDRIEQLRSMASVPLRMVEVSPPMTAMVGRMVEVSPPMTHQPMMCLCSGS